MDYPATVSIALTTKCNANCVMCWRRHIDNYGMDMTTDTYSSLIASLTELPPKTKIFISTGEPTVSSLLGDFLSFCAEKNFIVILYSNAQLVPEKLDLFLAKGGSIILGLSIDGGTEDIVSQIQRGCSLQKMLNSIACIRKMPFSGPRPEIEVNFIANSTNITTLLQLVEVLDANSVNKIQVSPMKYFPIVNSPKLQQEINIYKQTDYTELFSMVQKIASAKGIQLKIYPANPAPVYFPERCLKRSAMAVITVNGDLFPCGGTENYILGNIKDESLVSLWNGVRKKELVQALQCNNPLKCCAACSLSTENYTTYYKHIP